MQNARLDEAQAGIKLARYITAATTVITHRKNMAILYCSDFGAQGDKVSHCFHYFPIYLP